MIVEFDLLGTNSLAKFKPLRHPQARRSGAPMIAVFFFDDDHIINERIYFDTASRVTQIGRGELLNFGRAPPMTESSLPTHAGEASHRW